MLGADLSAGEAVEPAAGGAGPPGVVQGVVSAFGWHFLWTTSWHTGKRVRHGRREWRVKCVDGDEFLAYAERTVPLYVLQDVG